MKNLLLSILSILTITAYGQLVPTDANVSAPQPPSITGKTGNIFSNSIKNLNGAGYAAFAASVGNNFGAGYTSLYGTDPNKNAYIYNSRGVLLPRLTYAQRIAVSSPTNGLTVYQTNTSGSNILGYYYYNGSAWLPLGGNGSITGTANRIPYFGTNGSLTTDSYFFRDSTNGESGIYSIKGDTMISLQISPTYAAAAISVEDTVTGKAATIAAVISGNVIIYESPDADTRIDMDDYSMAISATSALAALERTRIIIDTTQITFTSGEKFGFQNNYSFPTDTGSVGQVLGVDSNDGTGNTFLTWKNGVNGCETFCDTFHITSSQILSGNTPKTLIAAPGAGNFIEVVSASFYMNFVSAEYGTNTNVVLSNPSASVAQADLTGILGATSDAYAKFDLLEGTTGSNIYPNEPLQFRVLTGNPVDGDGTATIYIYYRIVSL